MKKLFFLAACTPGIVLAQDHVGVLKKFVNYYNKQQTDNICTLFPDEKTSGMKCFWRGSSTDGTYDIYGKIMSYKYIGEDGTGAMKVEIYQMVFSKKDVIFLKFNLNPDNKFRVFLMESSQ